MYFVTMTINGERIPSSAVTHGSKKHCERVAKRLNYRAHPAVLWIVVLQAIAPTQKEMF